MVYSMWFAVALLIAQNWTMSMITSYDMSIPIPTDLLSFLKMAGVLNPDIDSYVNFKY